MKKFIFSLFLILLVSGCAGMPDIFNGIFPGTGNKVNKTELSPDLLVIQNINVLPNPPVNAEDEFTVSFEIKNQDDINEVRNVKYTLYDWGLCTAPNDRDGTFGSFAPQQTEFMEWSFKAPKNDEIAYLPNRCPIRFKINYTINTTSQIDVDVISKDRLSQLQRAGNSPTYIPSLTIGRGPIKIDLSFGAILPARDGTTLPVYITVQDKGSGLLKEVPNDTVDSGKKSLTLKIPKDFDIGDCEKFNNSGSDSNYKYYKNNVTIPLIKKSSPQIRCSFVTPSTADVPSLVEKTYFITASLEYDYDIFGETVVSVKPTSNK